MSNLTISINEQVITLPKSAKTGARSLLVLGVALHTVKNDKDTINPTLAVSDADIFDLENEFCFAEDWLDGSLQCIGELLGDLQYKNIEGESLQNLGFLISGLSELQASVRKARMMMPNKNQQA